MSLGNFVSTITNPVAAPSPFGLETKIAWPTTMFVRLWRDHAQHAPGMIQEFERMKAQQKHNIDSGVAIGAKSAEGLFESRMDLFETTEHPDVRQLGRFCASSVRRAVWEINGREVDAKRIRIEFKDSWYHITNHSGFHDAHYHGGCSWCGIYYVQSADSAKEKGTGAGNGVSRFYAPFGRGGLVDDYGNRYLGQGMLDFPPRDGVLVLFPAYLLHSGLPYSGEKDRILVAFNACAWLEDEPSEI